MTEQTFYYEHGGRRYTEPPLPSVPGAIYRELFEAFASFARLDTTGTHAGITRYDRINAAERALRRIIERGPDYRVAGQYLTALRDIHANALDLLDGREREEGAQLAAEATRSNGFLNFDFMVDRAEVELSRTPLAFGDPIPDPAAPLTTGEAAAVDAGHPEALTPRTPAQAVDAARRAVAEGQVAASHEAAPVPVHGHAPDLAPEEAALIARTRAERPPTEDEEAITEALKAAEPSDWPARQAGARVAQPDGDAPGSPPTSFAESLSAMRAAGLVRDDETPANLGRASFTIDTQPAAPRHDQIDHAIEIEQGARLADLPLDREQERVLSEQTFDIVAPRQVAPSPAERVAGYRVTTAGADARGRAALRDKAEGLLTPGRVLGLRRAGDQPCRGCGYVHPYMTGHLRVADPGSAAEATVCGIPVLVREGDLLSDGDPSEYVMPEDGQPVLFFGRDGLRLAIAVHVPGARDAIQATDPPADLERG